MSTIVDPPHQAPVTALAAGHNFAVTAAGSQFKVWALLTNNAQWDCVFAGSYQDLPCTSITIAPDNSLVAAVFDKVSNVSITFNIYKQVVTIWSLAQRQLLGALPHPSAVTAASFVGRRGRLASVSNASLLVWDLLSLQGVQ